MAFSLLYTTHGEGELEYLLGFLAVTHAYASVKSIVRSGGSPIAIYEHDCDQATLVASRDDIQQWLAADGRWDNDLRLNAPQRRYPPMVPPQLNPQPPADRGSS